MTGAIAIIPARGGSRGIVGKNLKVVGGKPLIQWSIEAAREAGLAAMVTSDSDDILDVAHSLDAYAIKRPDMHAADDSTTESALQHAISELPPIIGGNTPMFRKDVAIIVLLQPTSPIRQPGEIESALRRFRECGADSLFSARRVEGFVWFDRDNGWEPCYDPVRREMRQATQGKLEENGSIYIFKPWVLEQFNSRIGGKVVAHEMHPLDSFQVDEPADLELMEQLIPLRMPQRDRYGCVQMPLAAARFVKRLDGVFVESKTP